MNKFLIEHGSKPHGVAESANASQPEHQRLGPLHGLRSIVRPAAYAAARASHRAVSGSNLESREAADSLERAFGQWAPVDEQRRHAEPTGAGGPPDAGSDKRGHNERLTRSWGSRARCDPANGVRDVHEDPDCEPG